MEHYRKYTLKILQGILLVKVIFLSENRLRNGAIHMCNSIRDLQAAVNFTVIFVLSTNRLNLTHFTIEFRKMQRLSI